MNRCDGCTGTFDSPEALHVHQQHCDRYQAEVSIRCCVQCQQEFIGYRALHRHYVTCHVRLDTLDTSS